MRRYREAFAWSAFLLFAGIFLLLKNLNVFRQWGDLIWGALFAVAGLAFLVWLVVDLARWWRALPGFTLVSVGALLILQSQGIVLREWTTSLVLFGLALGFWAVLLLRQEHWWALVPAGVLTVLGLLLALWARLDDPARLALLFGGIGLVFLLLYVIRFDQTDTRWAAIPAAALLLLGLVTLMQALELPEAIRDWWPILLAVGGLGLLVGTIGMRNAAAARQQPAVPEPAFEAPPLAPGASVTRSLPEAIEPERPGPGPDLPEPPATAPSKAPGDIYDLIRRQPAPAEPPADAPAPGASVDVPPSELDEPEPPAR